MKKMMPNMDTYGGQENPGYKPPSGSAGAKAKGEYSYPKNTMSVPKKGSSIGPGEGNMDRQRAMSNQRAQASEESLRGQPC